MHRAGRDRGRTKSEDKSLRQYDPNFGTKCDTVCWVGYGLQADRPRMKSSFHRAQASRKRVVAATSRDNPPREWLTRRITARSTVAVSVLAAHVLFIAGALPGNSVAVPGTSAGAPTSIEVILLAGVEPAPLQVVPVLRRISVRPPPVEAYVAPQASTDPDGLAGGRPGTPAEPSSPPFEQLIIEARPQDAGGLHDFCTSSYPPGARSLNEQGTVVLLVRVEADGHVSDMKLEESSGSIRLDQVTQACVIGGLFEPHRAGLRAVGSWQRIHWTWSPTS